MVPIDLMVVVSSNKLYKIMGTKPDILVALPPDTRQVRS